ncbi:MAG TPA: cyanophycin synthetase, partial [Marmoricola sp.]|nr:cyanophycin synthetase [Marmoricola sp.]
EHNPGRMNFFTFNDVSIVLDLAHNEAGLEALIEIMRGVVEPERRLLLGLGVVGDRTEELITNLGEIAAKGCDTVVIGHKLRYLRGRTVEDLEAWMRTGAARAGVHGLPANETELAALQALLQQAQPGDVVGLMCHAQLGEIADWLIAQGGRADTPDVLREKVRRAHSA